MDRLLDQLTFHPFFAAVGVFIFLAGLVLGVARRSEGPALLPKMTALALLAGSFGIASSALSLYSVFQGMAMTGNGGYGAAAAGFSEVDSVFLFGISAAFLTLAVGLILTVRGTAGSPAAGPGTALKPMPSWLLGLLTVFAIVVVALSLHRVWLLQLSIDVALTPKGAPIPVSGSVEEVSQRLASHLIFLTLSAMGMVLGCAAFLIALFAAGKRSLSSRQALWARLLAALLLVLALGGAVPIWRQFNHLIDIAMVGKPF